MLPATQGYGYRVRLVLQSKLPDAEQAAGDLGGSETLRMLKQQLNHDSVHSEYAQQALYPMSRQIPYSPMGKPQAHVTQDRMRAILEKNSSKAAQSAQQKSGLESWPAASKENAASAQPPRPSGKLEWEERLPGSMGRYTKCHWYSCCQIGQGDSATFEVWTRNPLTGGMKQLAIGLKDFNEGRRVAQADADEHYARGDR